MKLHRIDHVGVNVDDLSSAKAFFLDLGFVLEGEADVEGPLFDRVNPLEGVRAAIAFLRIPGAQTGIELIKYYAPADDSRVGQQLPNALGIRHISIVVEDIEAIVAKLKERGTTLVSEIQNYEDTYKVLFVRGPEGIILELDEQITKAESPTADQ